tara:strand:- start:48005 stop:48859 length:855 start_codon:yes stop_codon:yes gene_type:complete
MELFSAFIVALIIILTICLFIYIKNSINIGLSNYFAANYKSNSKKSNNKVTNQYQYKIRPFASFSSQDYNNEEGAVSQSAQSAISQSVQSAQSAISQSAQSAQSAISQSVQSAQSAISQSTQSAQSSSGNNNAVCKIHNSSSAMSGELDDWLGGKADAPLKCSEVNWTAVNNRNRFKKQNSDVKDGYGGAKHMCETLREVNNDGTQQIGCKWTLDENLNGYVTKDNNLINDEYLEEGRGLRDWLEENVGEDEETVRQNGPCQPTTTLCANQKVKGDNVVSYLEK